MENLTPDAVENLFIEAYKLDSTEMRVWLEHKLHERVKAQFDSGDITADEFAEAKKAADELIEQARQAVKGVQTDA